MGRGTAEAEPQSRLAALGDRLADFGVSSRPKGAPSSRSHPVAIPPFRRPDLIIQYYTVCYLLRQKIVYYIMLYISYYIRLATMIMSLFDRKPCKHRIFPRTSVSAKVIIYTTTIIILKVYMSLIIY